MQHQNEVYLTPKNNEQCGDIEKLSYGAVNSPEMQKKVKKTLKKINETRYVKLRLIEIVSADREIVNGIKEKYVLKLRESGRKQIMEYDLYRFENVDDKNVEVRLTLRNSK